MLVHIYGVMLVHIDGVMLVTYRWRHVGSIYMHALDANTKKSVLLFTQYTGENMEVLTATPYP